VQALLIGAMWAWDGVKKGDGMNKNMDDKIEEFLKKPSFAVAGASTNREKYGNKIVRVYQQNNLKVYPINPKENEVEGETAYKDLRSVPENSVALSVVTPPRITLQIVKEAIDKGVRNIWIQPGAEHEDAISEAEAAGISVIHGGPCVLVALGYVEEA
jgi:uncharacterized protein